MKVLKFNDAENSLKVQIDSFDDLYLMARLISKDDKVEGRSFRRFKPSEDDKGEQKEVYIKINVEKTDLDKGANKLRLTGKIISGHPEEFIKFNSYHTINVGQRDIITIEKQEWKDYIIRRIKQAVADTKKPKLGVIAIDDEKATIAYIKGYGIDIISEIYSHLSKRLKEADFAKARDAYFDEIISSINNMEVDIVVIAGPGFMKDDIKKYIEEKRISTGKKLLYVTASDAERSGVREAAHSNAVLNAIEQDHLKDEFILLNTFMNGIQVNASFYGYENVKKALEEYKAGIVIVNDNVLNDKDIQTLLDIADMNKVPINIFNSDDEAGQQLSNFKSIAAISKQMISRMST
jgi:protein pelota